jgi:hypothetical protein
MPTYSSLFQIPFLETTTFSVFESNNHYRILEALTNPRVLSIQNTPPTTPQLGFWYEVGTVPTGDFAGHVGEVATKITDFWFFVNPVTVQNHFISPTNQYYNPQGFIIPESYYAATFGYINDIDIFDVYYSYINVQTNYTGCSLDLSTNLPTFKGQITINNIGANTLNIIFKGGILKTLAANTLRQYISDGVNIYN